MKKRLLLATLIGNVIAIGISQGAAHAASFADQTVIATLGQMKQVVGNGSALSANIDPDTGQLSAAMTPSYTITTNTNGNTNMTLKATCLTTGLPQNAFFGDGSAGGTYIVLTNNTVLPPIGAVSDAKLVTPTPSVNANVIVYSITPPADVGGTQLVYTWQNAPTDKYWTAVLHHKGNTNTDITIPIGTPKSLTYSFDDEPGQYEATVTLSFV